MSVIWTPGTKTMVRREAYVTPGNDLVNGLPLTIVDPCGLTMDDEEFLDTMRMYAPNTSLRAEDLVYITEVPVHVRDKLRKHDRHIPLIWKVRFVVSAWAFELHNLAHCYSDTIMGVDHATSLIEAECRLPEDRFTSPIVYAHALPHGKWPDTACWFPARCLRKIAMRDPNAKWETVLDEAKAPNLGYDTDRIIRPFVWNMAPDLYKNGENLGKPLPHEEATIHTACLLGMEDMLLGDFGNGVDPHYINSNRIIDPNHDIFKKETGCK